MQNNIRIDFKVNPNQINVKRINRVPIKNNGMIYEEGVIPNKKREKRVDIQIKQKTKKYK